MRIVQYQDKSFLARSHPLTASHQGFDHAGVTFEFTTYDSCFVRCYTMYMSVVPLLANEDMTEILRKLVDEGRSIFIPRMVLQIHQVEFSNV